MYEPDPFLGQSLEEMSRYINQEFNKLASLFAEFELDSVRFNVHHTAPDKPEEGHVYAADGTDWDPGFGKGLYYFNGNIFMPLITPPEQERIPKTTLRLISYPPIFTNTSQVFSPPLKSGRLTSYAPTVS